MQQLLQKSSIFRAKGNSVRGIFPGPDHSVSNAVKQKRGKKIPSYIPNLSIPELLSQTLLDTSISCTLVSSEHSNFTKGWKVKILSQKFDKTDKRPQNFQWLLLDQNPFYCAARTNEIPKSGNNVTRGNRFDRPADQRNAE